MEVIHSTISARGRVTIPAEIRRNLGLAPGDGIAFVVNERGEVMLEARCDSSLAKLRGAAGSRREPLDWHTLREVGRAERHR